MASALLIHLSLSFANTESQSLNYISKAGRDDLGTTARIIGWQVGAPLTGAMVVVILSRTKSRRGQWGAEC